jgi:hypothetical protein
VRNIKREKVKTIFDQNYIQERKLTYCGLVKSVTFGMKKLCDGLRVVLDKALLVKKLDPLARLLAKQHHAAFLKHKNYVMWQLLSKVVYLLV